ncbi:MAG: ABC transporter permease [Nocardioides sp.]
MWRLTLRNLFARKVRLVMSGLAIVLGVAFLAGVLVFSNGLSTTFDTIIKGSTPDAQVRLTGLDNFSADGLGTSAQLITPDQIAAIAAVPEVARADGGVDGLGLSLLDSDGALVGGTGAPTLAFNYNDTLNMDGQQILVLDSGKWPTAPGEVVLDASSADRADYELGDTVTMLAPYGEVDRAATLVGTANFNGGGTAGATLVLFDTEQAQDIFLGGADAFTSVALTAVDGVSQTDLVAAVNQVVPDGFEAVTGDQIVEDAQSTVGAILGVISTFLLVFALIAVLVGGFIIVNTFSILVAQRIKELALLRALGASRNQVTRSVLTEALVMALIATTIGIGIGWALARGLAALFGAVGLEISGSALVLTPAAVITSYLVGVLVTLVAAYLPARRAGKVAPVAAMRSDGAQPAASLRRRTIIGVVIIVFGAGLAVAGIGGAPGPAAVWVGAAALLWVLTVAAISSVAGRPVLVACRAVFGRLFGMAGRLAGENALRDPRRTGATASALMIGLALVSVIGVLAASLNKTVDDTVDEQFTSDFLVQSTNFQPFTTAIGDQMEQVDGVETLDRQQFASAILGTPSASGDDTTVFISGAQPTFAALHQLDMIDGTARVRAETALVDTDIAADNGWAVGDDFELSFPGGNTISLTVGGIFEPAETSAPVVVAIDQLVEAGLNRQDSSIAIMVAPGADPAAVQAGLDSIAGAAKTVAVYDKESFAKSIRDQVNQLLYMIYGLLALAIVIAVIGIINTLGLSVIERTREIGLLRAIGMSRARLRRMITLESVAISVLGAVLGMVLGVLVGALLRRALEDDITALAIPWGQLLVFFVISVVVGVIAAVLPAIRASRLNVLAAISTE